MFCSAFFITLHNCEKTTRQSVLALLVESLDFYPERHVIPALSRVGKGFSLPVGLISVADAREGDPLAQGAADLCVGTLRVHYIRLFLAHAVAGRADRQVYRFTRNAGGNVKAPGDVVIVGLRHHPTISICLDAGQWHALPCLNECRGAVGGLDLLNPAVTAGRADNAGVRRCVRQVAVAGVDSDQQAFGRLVEFREQVLEVLNF